MKSERISIELKLRWDKENSTKLTKKIYEIVEEHHIRASIRAKASELELVITILVGSYPILRDIISWIKEQRKLNKELDKVKIRHWRRITAETTPDSKRFVIEEIIEEA